MAATSVTRDSKTADVRRLAAAGVSQRQIASRLGISRGMVQRILDSPDQAPSSGSDVAEFRRDLVEALNTLRFSADAVDPAFFLLEKAEERFNAEYGLTGAQAVKAAWLRCGMAEGCVHA